MMMRVRSDSGPPANDRLASEMGSCDDTAAADVLLVGFKRTLHPPVPVGKKHSYRYPHHHHHHSPRVLRVPKFLSFLLFLVICDSQTVSRVAFRTSAATVRPASPAALADAHTDSIIISSDGDRALETPTSGAAINHTKLQEIVLEGLGLSALPDVRLRERNREHVYESPNRNRTSKPPPQLRTPAPSPGFLPIFGGSVRC
uniref:Uncharacterized protein n=1 Tax=Anopheles farauti TaxID=69004 RepID=A0A182QCT3_9DIPT